MTDPRGTEPLPDLTGRQAVVTGATSGIGRHTALELARAGCEVVLAARDPARLEATETAIRAEVPGASLRPLLLDLADQSSVRRAAGQAAGWGPVHLLVNNAGVMATPYHRTVDGFELQLGTNHFGHFLLTGLLLPQLAASGDARVVTVSSQMHRLALRAPLGDPRTQQGRYQRWQAYAQSKLANLLFAAELDRRAHEAGLPLRSLAVHPGLAATSLMSTGRRTVEGDTARTRILDAAFGLVGQPAAQGARPTLAAATGDLPGGTYVGPGGFASMRGAPVVTRPGRLARDRDAAARLWELSERATGISYP